MDGFPWSEVVRIVGTVVVLVVQWYLARRPPSAPPGDKGAGNAADLKRGAAQAAGVGGTLAVLWT